MNRTTLLRIAFHNMDIAHISLGKLAYRSPIRREIEREMRDIVSKHPEYVKHASTYQCWGGYPPPLFTVETFADILAKTNCLSDETVAARMKIVPLFDWWKTNLKTFSDDQAPAVYCILDRLINSTVDQSDYIIMLLNLLPETDAYDRAREMLGAQFRSFVSRYEKPEPAYHPHSYGKLFRRFSMVDCVKDWDITGKNFQATKLENDSIYAAIRERRIYGGEEMERTQHFIGLSFALRTEKEFLEYWKPSTPAWRLMLATMYGKISETLLEKFVRRYHRNNELVTKMFRHPKFPDDRLMFYAIRGNTAAVNEIERRKAVRIQGTRCFF